jgi:CDP-glucose 4,6-dehydratase
MNREFWRGKRVLVTGHTGFKGTWLSALLDSLGARVAGIALSPEGEQNLFTASQLANRIDSEIADIRNEKAVRAFVERIEPEVTIHLAAQALVRRAYKDPVETYSTNVMGLVHLLEAIRNCKTNKVFVNVTSDKCYANKEWEWPYRESDELGGSDPYSSSKACSEIVTNAYYRSFLSMKSDNSPAMGVATARAGNVIGGGDASEDRLLVDIIASINSAKPLTLRYPQSVRPWQHVLEPLSGYITLAEKLHQNPAQYSGAWNFGPSQQDARTVRWIAEQTLTLSGSEVGVYEFNANDYPEAHILRLDCTKSQTILNWTPRWNIERALSKTIEWNSRIQRGESAKTILSEQISEYLATNDNGE